MPNNNTRNWVARAGIMRKGGAHEKSNKAKRQQANQAFKRKMRAEQFGSFFGQLKKSTILLDLSG